MDKRIADIVARMKPRGHADAISVQTADMADLLSLLAEEQAQAADKMERHTRKLIYLTWALVVLTAVLLAFTIVLYKDTHTLVQYEQLSKDHKPKQP